jgi:hypothetical protein
MLSATGFYVKVVDLQNAYSGKSKLTRQVQPQSALRLQEIEEVMLDRKIISW